MAFSLGFSNFRQFKQFPPISIGGITILVGSNNSGKSTLVKALLELSDFFHDVSNIKLIWYSDEDERAKGRLVPMFFFDKRYLTHIGTFSRAHRRQDKSNTISFEYCDDTTKLEITIKGPENENKEESTYGFVSRLLFTDLYYNIDYIFDFENEKARIIFHSSPRIEGKDEYEKKEMSQYFASVPQNAEINLPLGGLNFTPRIKSNLKGLNILRALKKYIDVLIWLSEQCDITPEESKKIGLTSFLRFDKDTPRLLHVSPEMRKFAKSNIQIELHEILGDAIEYIHAHAANQNIIQNAKDNNDYVAQTIHEYAIADYYKMHEFVIEWMEKFEIGADYKIQSIGGEAYLVKIISSDGTEVNLADKGMGSIQLMIMLFRLALLKEAGWQWAHCNKTIIIEEPEQNLHPKLQSKLAEFFYEMHEEYSFDFLIETHSEYLIRKTQVLVKEDRLAEEGKENPFLVYYFGGDNADGKPYYQMKYRPDGIFANEFGKGFFDEAAGLAIKIL